MKKQFCGYCPENKCLLDCKICNPKNKDPCNSIDNNREK